MGSTFNPQILVDKLAKLNNSQQSIETLSHWCIFHMNKAKLVVETWERQFHCSPRERRLAFLYLANDILQNSRRKGAEFVAEFWRVLPEALRDVIRNGDEFAKNAALRLISIWDERKVFGSRGHILKEEFMGRHPENNNKSGRQFSLKLRQSVGEMLDKIISDYEVLYGGQLDEDVVLSRCSNTISGLEKIVKDIDSRGNSGQQNGSGSGEELQGKHAALRECIEQLTALETSRAILVSHLREALQEQELKLDQVRGKLQAAQLQWEQSGNLCREFVGADKRQGIDDASIKGQGSGAPPGFTSAGEKQSATPVMYKRQVTLSERGPNAVAVGGGDEDSRKSTAAAVAAKLTASPASAEMLSHVLTSLVSGGIIDHSMTDSPRCEQQSSEKRQKVESESSFGSAPPPPPPPPPGQPQSEQPQPPPYPHPDVVEQPPPPSSSPPPLPPLPPLPAYSPIAPPPQQFLHTAGPMPNVSYTYGTSSTQQQLQPPTLPSYTPLGAPPYAVPPLNPYQNFQGPDAGFYPPPSSVPMSSISRQQTL